MAQVSEPVEGRTTTAQPRCAHCSQEVASGERAPCPDCGVMLHGSCYVRAGGCTTPGCANATVSPLVATAHSVVSSSARARATVGALSGAAYAAGASGMGLSLLTIATGFWEGAIAGAFGLVAGSLLTALGILGFALVTAYRVAGASSPYTPGLRLLAASTGLCGIGGMLLSFAFLCLSGMMEMMVGGAGFVAGAVLVLAGGLTSGWLWLDATERA